VKSASLERMLYLATEAALRRWLADLLLEKELAGKV
jgi:hypothetical protein